MMIVGGERRLNGYWYIDTLLSSLSYLSIGYRNGALVKKQPFEV